MATENPQSKRWLLVINNPQDCGLDHERLKEILSLFHPLYYCMADEIANTGTYHTHIYLFTHSPVRFSTLKNRLPTAHMEKAYGSSMENRDYITKSGKWADTDKAETSVAGTFFEFGELPTEAEEKSPVMHQLLQSVKEGMTNTEIIEQTPSMAFHIRDIDVLRQTLLAERYAVENRKIEVTYLYGSTGAGKTWGIFDRHDPRSIYRVTNYRAARGVSFDGYHGQDVLVFEEFHSQIPVEDMLNYLDIYPLSLPARYSDRVACYTKVYFTSNIPLEGQYQDIQRYQLETWRAFLRRVQNVIEYLPDGTTVQKKKGGWPCDQK